MRGLKKRGVKVKKVKIPANGAEISALILSPEKPKKDAVGLLWLHGGGYFLGMKEMAYISSAAKLTEKYGAVVVCPGYRLSIRNPYPAAAEDCYSALLYLKKNASVLGAASDKIAVGGESAGGGLCAAVAIMARDRGEVSVAFQLPLYPMLDDRPTDSSRDNHGRIWNTRKNRFAWKLYLRKTAKTDIPVYAAPARLEDFSGLPPAYTFIGIGEPFYCETKIYIERLKACGVPAKMDVYDTDFHAFSMLKPKDKLSRLANERFNEFFKYASENYSKKQPDL